MLCDQVRVALVGWVAVCGQDRGDHVTRRRELRQSRDDGGIESAAEADDKTAGAARAQLAAHPTGNSLRRRHREDSNAPPY